MKQIFIALIATFLPALAFCQDLTGIWRGSFWDNASRSKSRYEVQIDDSKKPIGSKKAVAGVTYSYGIDQFFGKATLIGIWNPGTKTIIFEEKIILDSKNARNISVFTVYLDYKKENGKETLVGTFTSKDYKTGVSAGDGTVYLERVNDSDFEEEDFIKNNKKAVSIGKIKPGTENFVTKKPVAAPKKPAQAPVAKAPLKKTAPTVKAPTPTSKANKPLIEKKTPTAIKKDTTIGDVPTPMPPVVTQRPNITPGPVVEPPVALKERSNELFQTITTNAREILIDFYDNGYVDGDIISVYDNNKQIVTFQKLDTKPISVKVNLDDNVPEHEIVMVAENLGTVPPNTALMIVQAGTQRYTLNLSSTEKKNAMVKFKYDAASIDK